MYTKNSLDLISGTIWRDLEGGNFESFFNYGSLLFYQKSPLWSKKFPIREKRRLKMSPLFDAKCSTLKKKCTLNLTISSYATHSFMSSNSSDEENNLIRRLYPTAISRINDTGFVPMPFSFLKNMSRLGLSSTEQIVVYGLMSLLPFKGGETEVSISDNGLATITGTAPKTIRRIRKSENFNKYIKIIPKAKRYAGEIGGNTTYDLSEFFFAMDKVILTDEIESMEIKKEKKKKIDEYNKNKKDERTHEDSLINTKIFEGNMALIQKALNKKTDIEIND